MKANKSNASNLSLSPPPEWALQKALWAGWPSHGDLWLENLAPARAEVAEMIKIVAENQKVNVMAMGAEAVKAAIEALPTSPHIEIFDVQFGDIWCRDTGPVFTGNGQALRFENNGWGEKYLLPYDDTIGDELARISGANIIRHEFVLEGGSIEWDGEGTILTTRECVLNPNRNIWTEAEAEAALKSALNAEKILWLDRGMVNDHTDGHIDNLARFVAPGKVVCQTGFGDDDPNTETYNEIADALSRMIDAKGQALEVIRIPSPGLVMNEDNEPVAASHVNFLITNKAVIVPVYKTESADEAVAAIQKLFPDRKVVGLYSRAILSGGGSFHCMTQQVPA
jgi:agmatine deiminase